MRNCSSLKISLKLSLLSAVVAAASVASMPIASAQEISNQWSIKVKTEELKRQFVYNGSKLSPVAKVTIKIKRTGENAEPDLYESIWCHDGHVIGLERSGPYMVKRGDLTHIEVEQKDYSEEENKAIAYSLMRLGLEAYHHFNPIIVITLPNRSFDSIADEMRNRKCEDFRQSADTSYAAGVLFNLESEPSGRVQRLIFRTTK